MLEVDETFRKLEGAIKTYFDPVHTSEKSGLPASYNLSRKTAILGSKRPLNEKFGKGKGIGQSKTWKWMTSKGNSEIRIATDLCFTDKCNETSY